ncbi:hypothetical protein ABT278_16180 [Streptomyces sp. NPDC001228]|uniref:hypothetical protein n=1 Tax=Streptomyces sp. NPDC001228 TaxID=3154381 RepID=UPI00331CC7BA
MLGTPHLAGTQHGRPGPAAEPAGPGRGTAARTARGAAPDEVSGARTGHHAAPPPDRRTASAWDRPADSRTAPRAAPRGAHRAARPARHRRALRRPVFIDHTGWRGRLVTAAAAGIALACLGYLVFLSALVAGLWRPVVTAPPPVKHSVFSHPDGPQPAGNRGGRVRADAPRWSSDTGPDRPGEARPERPTGAQGEGPVR